MKTNKEETLNKIFNSDYQGILKEETPNEYTDDGGKLYDTNDKKVKAVRKKGNIITFKEKFYPRGTSDDGFKQILVTGFLNNGSVKIEGKSYDTKWYDSIDSLIKDVDWEKMEGWHDAEIKLNKQK